MKTLAEVIKGIQAHASKHKKKELRDLKTFPIGKKGRQGDVNFKRIKDYTPGKPALTMQLAPGSTKGSRHIVEGAEVFLGWEHDDKFYAATAKRLGVSRDRLVEALKGPVIVAKKRFTITHPEHANVVLPAGVYVTWGQLDPKTMRRVAD